MPEKQKGTFGAFLKCNKQCLTLNHKPVAGHSIDQE